jgi:hypothetical protein
MKRIALIFVVVILTGLALTACAPVTAPRICTVTADTTGYIEAAGPQPRGGWIQVPVVKLDSLCSR